MVCGRFFKRFNFDERINSWVKGGIQFVYHCEANRRQEQAKRLMLMFIEKHNFQKTVLQKTKRFILGVAVI